MLDLHAKLDGMRLSQLFGLEWRPLLQFRNTNGALVDFKKRDFEYHVGAGRFLTLEAELA